MARASAAAVDRLSTRSQDLAEADLPPPPPPLKPVPVIHTQAYLVQTQQLPQVSLRLCVIFVAAETHAPCCASPAAGQAMARPLGLAACSSTQCLTAAPLRLCCLPSQVPQLLNSMDEPSQQLQQQHADLDSNALVWALKK